MLPGMSGSERRGVLLVRSSGGYRGLTRRPLLVAERLVEIRDQVVWMLESDGKP